MNRKMKDQGRGGLPVRWISESLESIPASRMPLSPPARRASHPVRSPAVQPDPVGSKDQNHEQTKDNNRRTFLTRGLGIVGVGTTLPNYLFRKHALGNYGDLLHAVVHDPAMLRYLDWSCT